VAGDVGAAAYFMTTSEDAADSMLGQLGTRYVITDFEMDTGKFWAMATWFNSSVGDRLYETHFVVSDPANPTSYQDVLLYNQTYYQTMISRLHNFDGSLTEPGKAYYIEYMDPSVSQVSIPVITSGEAMNASDAEQRAVQYNLKAPAGYHALAMNPYPFLPLDPVPALQHYRLVHESPTNVYNAKTPDIKYVKVFEYVKGAHIKGDGIIDVPVITNTNRTFTYRQQSLNGEFVVPYSTAGNLYGVKTTGKYHIENTTREFDVPEDAVINGLAIQ
jgi:hypothetical protein